MERSPRALVAALGPLTAGHLLAMLLVILPFALLVTAGRMAAPRSRSAPASLSSPSVFTGWPTGAIQGRWRGYRRRNWGFGRSPSRIAHGAALMLVPIYLGLCREADLDRGHEAAGTLINANLGMAVLVATVHAAAMIAAGGCCAWLVYRYLGLKFISQSWFNLDTTWAVSLILVGAIALVLNLT